MTDNDRKTFEIVGKRIRAWRKYKNMTQLDLASEADIPRSHLSRIEHGKVNFYMVTLLKLTRALGIRHVSNLLTKDPPVKKD